MDEGCSKIKDLILSRQYGRFFKEGSFHCWVKKKKKSKNCEPGFIIAAAFALFVRYQSEIQAMCRRYCYYVFSQEDEKRFFCSLYLILYLYCGSRCILIYQSTFDIFDLRLMTSLVFSKALKFRVCSKFGLYFNTENGREWFL